jgi:hypothetical protein
MLSAMLLVWATSAEAAADGADNGDLLRSRCATSSSWADRTQMMLSLSA